MSKTIWLTGDIHGNPSRLSTRHFMEQKSMDKSDVVIILGDFGLLWKQEESPEEKNWLDWLNKKPFTTCFIDGNHENYDRLFALPTIEGFGGEVGVIRDSIFWLKRGEVYTINGKTFFTFGGARSHDIEDGIINYPYDENCNWKEVDKWWNHCGKLFYRINKISWWEDEIEQDEAVYQKGLDNLEKCNNKVDFILTHCTNNSAQSILGFYETDKLTNYLEDIHNKVDFGAWYFGHYHMNATSLPHEYCLYDKIIQIA